MPTNKDESANTLPSRKKNIATNSENTPPSLPSWADELRHKYLSGEATLFLIHGNVYDLVQHPFEDKYVNIREFLSAFLGKTKDSVSFYNQSEGLSFSEQKGKDTFLKQINLIHTLKRKPECSEPFPKEPSKVLNLMEEFLRSSDSRTAMIIDFVETIVPEVQVGFMGSEDRANLITFQRWASDPRMVNTDNLVILITENLADVNRKIVTNPMLAKIQITLPELEDRKRYIKYLKTRYHVKSISLDMLSELTAGLSKVQIESIFRHATESKTTVSKELLSKRKREIIEQECLGLVEFIRPDHGFNKIGGMAQVKKTLERMVSAIKTGQHRQVPMGVLFVGPMGTGKTFLAEALAYESSLTCIKLKNFRDKWVGSTEANLERILSVIKAMGYVLVIIDEGDRSIGGQSGEGDGGTSSRVIARLKEFMSDTSHRGKIVFLMMTNRPDKLDADMKRSGRFDLKIPFFFPDTHEEREGVFKALLKKNHIAHQITDFSFAMDATQGYSGAEIESIVLLALGFANDDARNEIHQSDLQKAVADFIPSRDMAMIDYMELLAVFECSSRTMLPTKYHSLSSEELNKRLRSMRSGLI